MERLRATPETYTQKLKFIERAMVEKAHELVPKVRNMNECRWRRMVDIGLLYNAGPETTEESIAGLYDRSRELIR